MGELRERMKRDMEIRGFSPHTQLAYLRRVAALTRYLGRSPDEVGVDEIQRYQLYLTRERKVAWGTFNQTVSALRFFYGVTCKKDWSIEQIPYHKAGRRLPVVLNQREMQRLLEALENLKHRAIVMALYAGSLRVSEVVRLRPSDVDSQRMMLRVHRGKGGKDNSAGSRRSSDTCCPSSITTSSSRSPTDSTPSCAPIRGGPTGCSLPPSPRPCKRLRAIRRISGPRSASPACCTPGPRPSCITRTSTASSPAEGRQPRDLQLERPRARRRHQTPDARSRRIPATLSAPSRPGRHDAHPTLRLARQPDETQASRTIPTRPGESGDFQARHVAATAVRHRR